MWAPWKGAKLGVVEQRALQKVERVTVPGAGGQEAELNKILH